MITRRDVEEEIQRIEGGPPTMQACERLAVLYFVREHIGLADPPISSYSTRAADPPVVISAPDEPTDLLELYSDSDFAAAVSGRRASDVMSVIDELMSVLLAINPQLYRSVMRKLGVNF